jgi:hypothetical protein
MSIHKCLQPLLQRLVMLQAVGKLFLQISNKLELKPMSLMLGIGRH